MYDIFYYFFSLNYKFALNPIGCIYYKIIKLDKNYPYIMLFLEIKLKKREKHYRKNDSIHKGQDGII
jgi:hypothetical protein